MFKFFFQTINRIIYTNIQLVGTMYFLWLSRFENFPPVLNASLTFMFVLYFVLSVILGIYMEISIKRNHDYLSRGQYFLYKIIPIIVPIGMLILMGQDCEKIDFDHHYSYRLYIATANRISMIFYSFQIMLLLTLSIVYYINTNPNNVVIPKPTSLVDLCFSNLITIFVIYFGVDLVTNWDYLNDANKFISYPLIVAVPIFIIYNYIECAYRLIVYPIRRLSNLFLIAHGTLFLFLGILLMFYIPTASIITTTVYVIITYFICMYMYSRCDNISSEEPICV